MDEKERKIFEAVLSNPPVKGYMAIPDKKLIKVNKLLKESNVKMYKANLIVADIRTDKAGVNILQLSGGNNGNPDWPLYLRQIARVVAALPESWIIRIDYDITDDIFHCYIGLPDKMFLD